MCQALKHTVMPAEVQKQGKQAKKGKTLEEVEEEEGGTIKESRVPMAKTMRSQQRKGKSKGNHIAPPFSPSSALPVMSCGLTWCHRRCVA